MPDEVLDRNTRLTVASTLRGFFDVSLGGDLGLRSTCLVAKPEHARPVDDFLDSRGPATVEPAVYLFALPASGQFYVGETNNLQRRLREHSALGKDGKRGKVRAALEAEADRLFANNYSGSEFLTFRLRYAVAIRTPLDEDELVPLYMPAPLSEMNYRLLLEQTVLLTMRNFYPKARVLNAVERAAPKVL